MTNKIYPGYLCDVEGIKVGHAQNFDALTGVTVIVPDKPVKCGVDVRGSAPGTRETDLLKSENMVDEVNAVVLSGGSAFGLESSCGVMEYLRERDIGLDTGFAKVPIVVSAVIFDLSVGSANIRPDFKMGYKACENLQKDTSTGLIGAGTGASVGKILGNEYAMKSGLGQASMQFGDLKISALTVLNAFGDIFDAQRGVQIAGCYSKDEKKFLDTMKIFESMSDFNAFKGRNTTISIVATNGKLSKVQLNKVSQMAHDGFARSIDPVHTMFDGDTIFSVATGEVECDLTFVGAMAARCISRSIANAIYESKDAGGLKSYKSLKI